MDSIYTVFNAPPGRDVTYIIGASVLTTVAVLAVARLALQGKQERIYRSPRETLLPKLTEAEIAALPYPPDVLPGGRDVDSPVCVTLAVYHQMPRDLDADMA
jgi:hypothetical protein